MQKYLITGGNGRFATELKKILKDKKNFILHYFFTFNLLSTMSHEPNNVTVMTQTG